MKIDFDIPVDYWGDYLRGFFDGDGSIWKTIFRKNAKPYYYANFVSASVKFLENIRDRIGFGTIRAIRKKYFELKFNQRQCLELYKIMYANEHGFRLERKHRRFLKIDIKYKFWTKEEDEILFQYSSKKDLIKLLPDRSWESIKVRKNTKCRQKKL